MQNIRNNINKNYDKKNNNSNMNDLNEAHTVSTYVFFPYELSLSTATGAGDMYTGIFYYLYVAFLTYAFSWSAFLCTIMHLVTPSLL
jgi:hypothetical protein